MGAISFNGSIYPAGSTQASDSIYDNTNTGLPASVQGAIDKTTGNIASANLVELTSTAAHAHAVGTYFIWIGQFVKVTSAIAVGDTIVDGTNVEATSIADVLMAANEAIEGKLSPSDVVNNLTSMDTNLPLSAAQGKELDGRIPAKRIHISGTSDGTANLHFDLPPLYGRNTLPIVFARDGGYDGIYTLFFNNTQGWYVHVANFNGAGAAGVEITGYLYYMTWN